MHNTLHSMFENLEVCEAWRIHRHYVLELKRTWCEGWWNVTKLDEVWRSLKHGGIGRKKICGGNWNNSLPIIYIFIFYVCRLSLYFMNKVMKHINNGVDMPFIIHSSNFLHHIGCHVRFGGNINTKCGTSLFVFCNINLTLFYLQVWISWKILYFNYCWFEPNWCCA